MKIINNIIYFGMTLLCGYSIKKNIQKKYPWLKKDVVLVSNRQQITPILNKDVSNRQIQPTKFISPFN